MIKLVLSDMDRTLLPHGSYVVPKRTMEEIHELLQAGVLFGPASGRDYASILDSFSGDLSCVQTALLSNGKKVYLDGRLVRVTTMDRAATLRLAELIAQYPGCYVAGRDVEGTGFVLGITADQLARCHWGASRMGELRADLPQAELVTLALHFEEGSEGVDVDEVARKARAACPEFDFLSPGTRMFDVVPSGFSKAVGARQLCELLGISPDEVVVFGDSDNDLAMLQAFPNSVSVSNANERVRAAARYHIGSCDEDAVGQALFQIARAVSWGEVPAFMKRGNKDARGGAQLGDESVAPAPRTHYLFNMLCGVLVTLASVRVYVTGQLETLPSMFVLVVGLLAGVALFYLGLGQRRDARKARKDGGRRKPRG